jgi:hypothetical protein
MTKKITASLIFVVLLASAARAGVELLSVSVNALGDHARLEWRTGQEINFQTFVVERSPNGEAYQPVGQVQARGSFSEYYFTDQSPLDVENERTFFYRLKLLNRDGTFIYSDALEVSLSFSPVQQTWGTIKAMFR